ncbi:hypothetical protein FACS1894121_1290 [Bacteroidia bacterium]|nr:hypothetical protein FACS1894121_1290 [Bacteroidia bacterium]
MSPEKSVAIALKSRAPLIEGEKISLRVDNTLQKAQVESIKMSIRNFLVKALNNGQIQLDIDLYDGQQKEEKTLFVTTQDKYEHFVKLNPVIEEMTRLFDLETE